jgi:hypothetical protein
MTKTEFIQRAVIAMTGKVIGTNGVTDGGEWDNVVSEAESLAELMVENGHL